MVGCSRPPGTRLLTVLSDDDPANLRRACNRSPVDRLRGVSQAKWCRTLSGSAVALAAVGLVGLAPAPGEARPSTGSAVSIAARGPSFVRHLVPSLGFGQVVEAVGVGDLNGDHRPDIVVAGDRYLLGMRSRPPGRSSSLGARSERERRRSSATSTAIAGRTSSPVRRSRPGRARRCGLRTLREGWRRHVLSSDAYCHDLVFAPVAGRGPTDAVCVDQQRGRIVLLTRRAPRDLAVVARANPGRRRRDGGCGRGRRRRREARRRGRALVVPQRGRRQVGALPVHDDRQHRLSRLRRLREGRRPRPQRRRQTRHRRLALRREPGRPALRVPLAAGRPRPGLDAGAARPRAAVRRPQPRRRPLRRLSPAPSS